MSTAAWLAWTAIGTGTLALVTTAAIIVAVRTATRDRQWDDARRAEDRTRDDALRAEERNRDDRLRHEAAELLERREEAERRAREDYEARQVLVFIKERAHPSLEQFTHYITVSTPHAYPIKQVNGRLAGWHQNTFGERGLGHAGDQPWIDENRTYFGFWSHSPVGDESPLIRWTDWHGHRYYQYHHYTRRFGQNAEWLEAAKELDEWIRTGPLPD